MECSQAIFVKEGKLFFKSDKTKTLAHVNGKHSASVQMVETSAHSMAFSCPCPAHCSHDKIDCHSLVYTMQISSEAVSMSSGREIRQP